MFVCSDPGALDVQPRAVALGAFDGVHVGHRALLDRARATGLVPTVVIFDPHPRLVLGRGVTLIVPLARRLELLEQAGITDTVVLPFTRQVAAMAPEEWAEKVLRPIGTRRVVRVELHRDTVVPPRNGSYGQQTQSQTLTSPRMAS